MRSHIHRTHFHYFLIGSESYSHLIDPRTALPVSHFASVTVVADTAETADALATALSVSPLNDSKSNLPPSNTADKRSPASSLHSSPLHQDQLRRPAERSDEAVPRIRRSPFATWFAATVRWLHIYVSLLGFTALAFFAVTGITLNHPTWFGADVQPLREFQGELPTKWLTPTQASSDNADRAHETGDQRSIDRLAIVEHPRATNQIRGAVAEFRADDQECMIIFKGPAYAADVYINRAAGTYRGTVTTMGAVALLNDLHKGRDSGHAWSLVIDISALVTVFVSVTGLILVLYIKRKRNSGVIIAVIGTVLLVAIYFIWVP